MSHSKQTKGTLPTSYISVGDPDQYIQFLPTRIVSRKTPILQYCFAFFAALLIVIALGIDELADGDMKIAKDSEKTELSEWDYDCGWQAIRFVKIETQGNSHSDSYKYSGDMCKAKNKVLSSSFCDTMEMNGQIWIGCSIVALLFVCSSFIGLWFQGKSSVSYVILHLLSTVCLGIASFNWLFNDKCIDLEDCSDANCDAFNAESATFDTKIGASLIIIFVAIVFNVLAILVSSIHFIQYQPQQLQHAQNMQRMQDNNMPNNAQQILQAK